MLEGSVFLGESIVPLTAVASRSLPAVASHAIGFAEPRPDARSPGSGRLRERRGGLGFGIDPGTTHTICLMSVRYISR